MISHLNRAFNLSIDGDKLPLGAIVALTDLTDCLEMVSEANATDVPNSIIVESVSELERLLGDWQPQRYAWKLENVRAIEPIPCLGKQKRLFGLCYAMDEGYKGWNPYRERHLAIFVNCF